MRWREAKKRRHQKPKEEIAPPVVYGRFWARVFAVIMDNFLLLAPITILTGVIFGYDALKHPETNHIAGNFQMAVYLIVTVLFWKYTGQTPGKKAFGLKVVDAKSFGTPPTWKLAIRFVSYFLSMVTLVGFFIPLFRKDKRALHDLIAGTAVIEITE